MCRKPPTRFYWFLIPVLSAVLTACPLLNQDDSLPSDDARMELQAASRELGDRVEEFRQSPPVESALFLIELTADGEPPASSGQATADSGRYTPDEVYWMLMDMLGVIRQNSKETKKGVYRYNFSTTSFDLINIQADYLEYIYPANRNSFNSNILNAALTLRKLEYKEAGEDSVTGRSAELLLSSLEASMVINNQTVMTLSYQAGINPSGLPTFISHSLKMSPYEISIVLEGNGQNYHADMSWKEDDHMLFTHSLSLRYTSDLTNIQLVSGHFMAGPVRLEGELFPEAAWLCASQDITCLDKSLDVTVRHTRLKKKLGSLGYRTYYDDGQDETYPVVHIIYDDGSSDLIDEVFYTRLNVLKRSLICR